MPLFNCIKWWVFVTKAMQSTSVKTLMALKLQIFSPVNLSPSTVVLDHLCTLHFLAIGHGCFCFILYTQQVIVVTENDISINSYLILPLKPFFFGNWLSVLNPIIDDSNVNETQIDKYKLPLSSFLSWNSVPHPIIVGMQHYKWYTNR